LAPREEISANSKIQSEFTLSAAEGSPSLRATKQRDHFVSYSNGHFSLFLVFTKKVLPKKAHHSYVFEWFLGKSLAFIHSLI
jgi:hypothetical protein